MHDKGAEEVIRANPLGQDFMHYLVDNGLTAAKYG